MKEKLKEALVYMVTEYCRYRKDGKDRLALSVLDDISGFKLGLYYSKIFSSNELDKIEDDVRKEWGFDVR